MTVIPNVGTQYQLNFTYDAKGRRIQKEVKVSGVTTSTTKFLYDGWNLVAELKSDNSRLRTYVWGNDLSGSMQGAGGVGGLLLVSCYGTSTTNCFPAYDGNGNVMAWVNASDSSIMGNYAYGPFGETIQASGVMAKAIPFRFSTKYEDDESDLLYYGYRYYKPSTGTWPNRDPIGENGGLNLYGMVGNNPIEFVDAFGLWRSLPFGAQHDTLTRNSFNTALGVIRNPPNEKCRKKMAKTLVDANVGQDEIGSAAASDNPRHFNRNYVAGETAQEVQQRRSTARDAYAQYLQQEEVLFNFIPECWARLEALGRISHSWQDYYAHGIHTSQGFVDPITGSPSGFTEFWPSSYPGEHSRTGESVSDSSRRFTQAETYVALRFRSMLDDWLQACKCVCEQ